MQSLTRFLRTTQFTMLLAVAVGIVLQPVHAAPGGGKSGGPSKVTVTAADPAEADQGTELDVLITGEGFDAGSSATFFIGGTSDDTQITVLSNEYQPSTGQLKSRIHVNGAALVTDYDIEVRNSSGRRGKGTTLFRVKEKVDETACTGLEDPTPTIAYLSELVLTPDIGTADFYLASDSGCDQYLLLENADQTLFTSDAALEISSPWDLRFDYRELAGTEGVGGVGVVVWRNISRTHGSPEIVALSFLFDGAQVSIDPAGPQPVYAPPDGWYPQHWDVRIDDAGAIELVSVEAPGDMHEEPASTRLVHVHLGQGTREVLLEGDCAVIDPAGFCARVEMKEPWWNATGDAIYFSARQWPEQASASIARLRASGGAWSTPETVITDESGMRIRGIRSDEVLSYTRSQVEYRRNGKVANRQAVNSIIQPNSCPPEGCLATDGFDVSVAGSWVHGRWTRDGGWLYSGYDGNKRSIRKFSEPVAGIDASFEPVGPVHNAKWQCDTSF